MPLLRDVVTAVGIDLEGHGGHSGSMDEGRPIHVGLHARICRPRRLWGRATLASYREEPLSEGRPALCATLPRTPATGSVQQGVRQVLSVFITVLTASVPTSTATRKETGTQQIDVRTGACSGMLGLTRDPHTAGSFRLVAHDHRRKLPPVCGSRVGHNMPEHSSVRKAAWRSWQRAR